MVPAVVTASYRPPIMTENRIPERRAMLHQQVIHCAGRPWHQRWACRAFGERHLRAASNRVRTALALGHSLAQRGCSGGQRQQYINLAASWVQEAEDQVLRPISGWWPAVGNSAITSWCGVHGHTRLPAIGIPVMP